nr:MAG TPA: putative tail fiber protein [Caudoviricetes sp.]
MEYTKNLKLHKPSYDDDVDIQVLNNNMDILDDRVGNLPYLPLAGGTMKGDIKLPYNTWEGLHSTRSVSDERLNDVLCFADTTLNTVKSPSVVLRSDRLCYFTSKDKQFAVDDTGVWWDNDKVLTDLWTNIGWHSGYTKLNNKMLIQWGYVNPQGSTYNVQHVTFDMPFVTPQYTIVTSRSYGVDSKVNNYEGRWGSATFNMTTTGFDIVCAEPSAYGHTEFWIAIGKGVE